MTNLFDPKALVYAELQFISPSRKQVDVLDMILDDVYAEMHQVFLGLPYAGDKELTVPQRTSIF